jgi:hypothetical protein
VVFLDEPDDLESMQRHPPAKERTILDQQRLAKRFFDVDPLVADVSKKSLSHRLDRKLLHGPTVPAQKIFGGVARVGSIPEALFSYPSIGRISAFGSTLFGERQHRSPNADPPKPDQANPLGLAVGWISLRFQVDR